MKTLLTPRLVLRDWTNADLRDLYAYSKDPAVGPNAGWAPHTSRAASRVVLESLIQEQEVWAIQLRNTGRVIGSIGLHNDRLRDEVGAKMLGYVLGKSYWGQGYTTEAARAVLAFAFETANLQLVSVYHFPANAASRRVIEKCGFTCEGILRRSYKRYDGQIFDQVCYSILREEYIARQTGA